MKKWLKKAASILLLTSFLAGSQMTVSAAPAVMADGDIFDAVYYAQNNPDVVAVFGNDTDMLYQHYVLSGKAEGRQAYHPAEDVAAILNTAAYAAAVDATLLPTDSRYFELKTAVPGSYVTFGKYEQDNNLRNGQEPIEWLVLENDGESLLVLSKYVLDSQIYYKAWDPVERKMYPTTWEQCDLRAWLNSTFYNTAFNAGEQMWIETTLVDNSLPENWWKTVTGGNDTYDKVFILSYEESMKYFPMTEIYHYASGGIMEYTPAVRVQATPYAVSQGVVVYDERLAKLTTEALGYLRQEALGYVEQVALRTPSSEQTWIEITSAFGGEGTAVVGRNDMGHRPAMRINIR